MMKQTSIYALGLALSLVAGAGLAQGQGQGGGRPGFGGFRGGFGGPGGGVSGLLRMPEVQAELKVDEAQKELLDQVNQETSQKMRQLFQPPAGGAQGGRFRGPSEEVRKQMAALQAEQLKKVGEILEPRQMARLKQLGVQQAGTRALAQDEVAMQLKLSADQRQRITAAVTAEQEAMRALFQGFRPGDGAPPSDEQRAELQKKMTDTRSATEARLLAVLTEPQKTQFKALQGAPFKFPEFRFGGPGGRRPGRGQNN